MASRQNSVSSVTGWVLSCTHSSKAVRHEPEHWVGNTGTPSGDVCFPPGVGQFCKAEMILSQLIPQSKCLNCVSQS